MLFPKKLLVEGDTDKRVIPYLMEANGVTWEVEKQPVVFIEPFGSVEEILKPGVIEAELRASGIQTLGLVVDANGNAKNRWEQIKNRCQAEFEVLPDDIPAGGLIIKHSEGAGFGVWIMPDNKFSGMLEDFLITLIPREAQGLLNLAKKCVDRAAKNGATYRRSQTKKAELHTWLAWQDEPGRQLHQAIHYRILEPGKPESKPFVSWFRSLFSV